MLAEFGVPVEWDGHEVKGIRDEVDVELLSGEGASFAGHQTSVLVKTGALPNIAAPTTILVESRLYRVARVEQVDDGALTRLMCAAE